MESKLVKGLKLNPLLLTDDAEDVFQSYDLAELDLKMDSWKCFVLKICCTHPGYKTPRFLLLNKTDININNIMKKDTFVLRNLLEVLPECVQLKTLSAW